MTPILEDDASDLQCPFLAGKCSTDACLAWVHMWDEPVMGYCLRLGIPTASEVRNAAAIHRSTK